MVLNITKELTREIFEEFPVVQDAYARYVPGVCPFNAFIIVYHRQCSGWSDKIR